MDRNDALIEYIFKNDSLDFYIDPDTQTIEVKDLDDLNKELFFEVSELKKVIFTMFVNEQDVAIQRIKNKLLESRDRLDSYYGDLTIMCEEPEFEVSISEEPIKEMNNLKISYIDELVALINNLSFETAHVPAEPSSFKTKYTVDELAYFFKLSIEQGILVLDKNQKTKFFDFIAANFQSKDQVKISSNSIRNKSYDPTLGTIEKIREDLLQMLQLTKAHRDTDKIQWKK